MEKEKKGRVSKGVGKSRKEIEIEGFFLIFKDFCAAQRIKSAGLETFATGSIFSHLKYNIQCSTAVERLAGSLLLNNE